jgi:hypothetical protein
MKKKASNMEAIFFSDYFQRPLPRVRMDDYDAIETGQAATATELMCRQLFSDCFKHHVTVADLPEMLQLKPDIGNPERAFKDDHISAEFLQNIYGRKILENGVFTNEFQKLIRRRGSKEAIDINDFLSIVTHNPFSYVGAVPESGDLGSNENVFILGEIGSGKSLLMSWLVDQVRRQRAANDGFATVPIYINFDKDYGDKTQGAQQLQSSFLENLTEKALNGLRFSGLEMRTAIESDFEEEFPQRDLLSRLRGLFKISARYKVRFILFFDNIDAYHYAFAKHSFEATGFELQRQSLIDSIIWLFDQLSDPSRIGHLGLVTIFACRTMVFEECKTHRKAIDPTTDYSWRTVYDLIRLPERDILQTRIELFKRAFTKKAAEPASLASNEIWKQKDFIDTFKIDNRAQTLLLIGEQENSQSSDVLNDIKALSHHGLRSFIDFLSDLKIEFDVNGQVFWRLFRDPAATLRVLYMADLRKRFSQAHDEHFPNVFLCDAVVRPDNSFPTLHKPHTHTYWVKYLILAFIQHSQDGIATFNDVLRMFVERCKYDKHLVTLAVGSLAAENHSSCLRATSFGDSPELRSLALTPRGERLLKKGWYTNSPDDPELVFNYDYLQLVVDDYLMAFPVFKSSIGENVYEKIYLKQADLSYLLAPDRKHQAAGKDYISKKGECCLHFFRVLEASFEVEAEQLAPLLSRFPQLDLRKRFPSIYESLCRHLERLLKSGRSSDPPKWIRNEATRISIDQKYVEFFETYFENPIDVDVA